MENVNSALFNLNVNFPAANKSLCSRAATTAYALCVGIESNGMPGGIFSCTAGGIPPTSVPRQVCGCRIN